MPVGSNIQRSIWDHQGDPVRYLASSLFPYFNENTPAAILALMSMMSGGIKQALSLNVLGPSSSGKTSFLTKLSSLFEQTDRQILFTSRITLAGLFAKKEAHIICEDELMPDLDYARVRRQLLSTGNATRILSTPGGDLREETLCGDIVFVTTELIDTKRDFQDSNRVLCLPLSDSAEQVEFHARMTAYEFTEKHDYLVMGWNRLAEEVRRLIPRLKSLDNIRFTSDTVERLLPPTLTKHFPRRISQVLRVATLFAFLRGRDLNSRSVTADGQNSMDGTVWGSESDIHDALLLIKCAKVWDDGIHLAEIDRRFLTLMGEILPPAETKEEPESMTIGQIVACLNAPHFDQTAAKFADSSKRRGAASLSEPNWTRGMVERRIEPLYGIGLLAKTATYPTQVLVTKHGYDYLKSGGANSFDLMFKEFMGMNQAQNDERNKTQEDARVHCP